MSGEQKKELKISAKNCQKWYFFFEKKYRKTLKKIVCYDIKYIGKKDKIFETKNGGEKC